MHVVYASAGRRTGGGGGVAIFCACVKERLESTKVTENEVTKSNTVYITPHSKHSRVS